MRLARHAAPLTSIPSHEQGQNPIRGGVDPTYRVVGTQSSNPPSLVYEARTQFER